MWRSRNEEVAWLFLGGLVVMGLSYFGALGSHRDLLIVAFGTRYSYAPSVLFGLTLLGVAANVRGVARWLAGILVTWTLVVNASEYFHPDRIFAEGPGWRGELGRWRADPAYHVQLWPDFPSWKHWLGPPPTAP